MDPAALRSRWSKYYSRVLGGSSRIRGCVSGSLIQGLGASELPSPQMVRPRQITHATKGFTTDPGPFINQVSLKKIWKLLSALRGRDRGGRV
jgi:hypothetical protein